MRKQISLKTLCEYMIICYNLWYIFPILRGVASGGIFQTLFFAINVLGMFGILLSKQGKIQMNAAMFPVLLMLFAFFVMTAFDIGDMSKHIRVCVSFWITGITYMLLDNEQRARVGRVLLVAVVITIVTSSIAVMGDNTIARTLTDSRASDELQLSYKLMNVSSIYLFQCFSVFVPVLFVLAKARKQKLIAILAGAFLLVAVVSASFTIALILFLISFVVSIILMNAKNKRAVIISILVIALVALIILNLDSFLALFIKLINNDRITEKLETIRKALGSDTLNFEEFGTRFELYDKSINTFFDSIIGIGPKYSFSSASDGIGYHSQLFDDLGRYGIFALAFYGVFFWGYYLLLKKEWSKLDQTFVAKTVTLLYVMMLVLNIGFKSAEEGIIMLFILPSLPEIILYTRKEKQEKANARITSQ